jgi:nitroimidazol reductase NimA-like FMN-containing flavoprotein (pyridoxamine 5'-phosphate oxidase superfamily)
MASIRDWTRMRRAEYAMPDDQAIGAMLARALYGFTATAFDEQPFLHPSLFWFDDSHRRIYFHGALQGRTLDNILHNPRVCFSVADIGRMIPAQTASGFENEYASVIAFGHARVVDTADEKRLALQALLDKYFPDRQPGRDYRPITEDEMDRTQVYAIEIESWSGKERKKEL